MLGPLNDNEDTAYAYGTDNPLIGVSRWACEACAPSLPHERSGIGRYGDELFVLGFDESGSGRARKSGHLLHSGLRL